MAKKDTNGQMNMFDFFGGDVQMVSLMPDDEFIDDAIGAGFSGGFDDFDMEVSMPKDIPEEENFKAEAETKEEEFKAEAEVEVTPKKKEKKVVVKESAPIDQGYKMTVKDRNKPVMYRCFSLSGNTVDATIAYLDYNRVYIKEPGQSPVCYQFASSKGAVNYYVDKMNEMSKDGFMKFIESEPVIVATDTIEIEE